MRISVSYQEGEPERPVDAGSPWNDVVRVPDENHHEEAAAQVHQHQLRETHVVERK